MARISCLASGYNYTDKCNDRWGESDDIVRITPHQMWAHWTGAEASAWFVNNGIENSVNYCIGYAGDIYANVPEENRAWTSASEWNDTRAITIELANSAWNTEEMTDDTLEMFMQLCCDLLFRYPSLGGRLNYTGDVNGNITLHRWYQDTNCPGGFFEGRLPYLVDGVNSRMDYYESQGWTSMEEVKAGKKKEPEAPPVEFEYRTYDDVTKSWLTKKEPSEDDYSGIFGHDVSGVAIYGATYQVHCWSGDENESYEYSGWLPAVDGYDTTDYNNGFAGNFHPIDALKITGNICYQVHLRKTGEWSEVFYGTAEGYAGTIGQPIDGIRIFKPIENVEEPKAEEPAEEPKEETPTVEEPAKEDNSYKNKVPTYTYDTEQNVNTGYSDGDTHSGCFVDAK